MLRMCASATILARTPRTYYPPLVLVPARPCCRRCAATGRCLLVGRLIAGCGLTKTVWGGYVWLFGCSVGGWGLLKLVAHPAPVLATSTE
jgi:hypothetical protein